jgi:pyruvate dehydrogenase E2 component (dihydrolipoamide acetyltransferase)
MAKVLEMPKLSPTMEEGVLSAWHKKEGDPIAVDDLLAEVETDKATMEFRSFDKATLLKLLVEPGSQVKLGQPVAIIGAPGEDISALAGQAETSAPAQAASPAQAPASAQAPAAAEAPAAPSGSAHAPPPAPPPAGGPAATPPPPETDAPVAQRNPPVVNVLDRASYPGDRESRTDTRAPSVSPGDGDGRVMASPYVRKVAREKGIDLKGAHGTGPGGRVVPSDLEAMAAQVPAPQPAGAAPAIPASSPTSAALTRPGASALPAGLEPPDARPLTPMRRTIARRLTESKATVPHFYLEIDADVAALAKLRVQINAELAPATKNGAPEGDPGATKISVNDLLVKACALALVRVPECNASFTPEAILIHHRVDISVAVAIPEGLVTPVVRNADRKSVAAIAREVRDLAARARAKKLKPEEMSDGTFSISNLGMFGIDQFAAVINPPEGAILAVGQVRDVPVVVDGAVVPGQRLALTLSCDHRVVDGAIGAAFLAELRRLIAHPMRILAG